MEMRVCKEVAGLGSRGVRSGLGGSFLLAGRFVAKALGSSDSPFLAEGLG